MKVFISYLIICSATFAFSQKPLKDFYLKRNLKQDGQNYQFTVIEEDKRAIWFYRQDKFYFWYSAQHVISTQGASSGTLLHGNFEGFYENKQLAQKGEFKRGLKQGEWMYWRSNGTLESTQKWSNGELKIERWFDEEGHIAKTVHRKIGKMYRESGDSVSVISRNRKKEDRFIYENDRLIKSEQLKNGQLDGTLKEYENGKCVIRQKYKDGVLVEKVAKEKKSKEENPDEITEESEKKTLRERLFKKERKEKKVKEEKPPKEPKRVSEDKPTKKEPRPKKEKD